MSRIGLILLFAILPSLCADFPQPGEWPCFRRDGGLLARSPARGQITEPRIVWKQFVGSLETEFIVQQDRGSSNRALPLDDTKAEAEFVKARTNFFQTDSEPSADPTTVIYADVLPDDPGKEKIEFESGFSKPTVKGQWQPCVGRCFAQRAGQWVEVWKTDPIDLLFQPLPLAGDFDADGHSEIAILPFHELILLDARTGRIKARCRFTDTRSYGFFGVYDFDRDGRSEFLVMGDFSKHVDVLGFREGKLSVLWQRAIELDISNPQKVLRVPPQPVADVDGDGRDEILINLFNDAGDRRWHLTACDAETGRAKYEFPDEQLAGVLDLDGDRASELLTIRSDGAGAPEFGVVSVWSARGGTAKRPWTRQNAALQMWDAPLPTNIKSTATLGRRTALHRGQALVLRERSEPNSVTLRQIVWTNGAFSTRVTVRGENLESMALADDGRMLLRAKYAPDHTTNPPAHSMHPATSPRSAKISSESSRIIMGDTKRTGISPGPVSVASPRGATQPTILVQGSGEEIVAFEPPAKSGSVLRRIPGRGQSTQWPETRGPVIADLLGDGSRQILFATAAPNGAARFAASDLHGRKLWPHDFPDIPGGLPIWNVGGLILWQAGYFTDLKRQDVLVTVRRSMMHSEETYLLSGKNGRAHWHRDRQVSQRGVGGAPFAIADFNSDGFDDACSLNPSILYILDGPTGRDLIARDATWDNVPAKPVYWGVPSAGDFLGNGQVSIFFGGRSMTGLVRTDGSLAWWDALDQSAPGWPAFGDFNGTGNLQSIGIGYDDGIRCYDLQTGKVQWRLPSPAPGTVTGCASADLDSDGRDEALFVIGQDLFCVATANNAGSLKWKLHLPTPCGPPTLAILEPGGSLSVLLAGSDGHVYCVR